MIFLFVPYYDNWNDYFQDCLDGQTEKFYLIKYNRKDTGIGWGAACNWFLKTLKTFRGIDDDVICIMNNDIRFNKTLMTEGATVRTGEILTSESVQINWKDKSISEGTDTFPGRTFFMTATDFMASGGFSLPHYLADYDFGLRMVKHGMKIRKLQNEVIHVDHPKNTNPWSMRSVNNPLVWSVFLLRHGRNRYFILNLLKIWYELIKPNRDENRKR